MPETPTGYRYILVLVCNITRFVTLVPLQNKDAATVAEAVLQRCVLQYGPCEQFISDLGKEWDNQVLQYVFKALKIEHKFVSVGNHKANKSERFIVKISGLITTCLTDNGHDWPIFVNSVAYAYNSFASPSLGNMSPYYLLYLRHPRTTFDCGNISDIVPSYREYVDKLKQRLQKIGKTMLEIQAQLQHNQARKQMNKTTKYQMFSPRRSRRRRVGAWKGPRTTPGVWRWHGG